MMHGMCILKRYILDSDRKKVNKLHSVIITGH